MASSQKCSDRERQESEEACVALIGGGSPANMGTPYPLVQKGALKATRDDNKNFKCGWIPAVSPIPNPPEGTNKNIWKGQCIDCTVPQDEKGCQDPKFQGACSWQFQQATFGKDGGTAKAAKPPPGAAAPGKSLPSGTHTGGNPYNVTATGPCFPNYHPVPTGINQVPGSHDTCGTQEEIKKNGGERKRGAIWNLKSN